MKLGKRLLALAVALGIAGGGLVVATPAQADQADYCAYYTACLYFRINYMGAVTGNGDIIYDYLNPRINFIGVNDGNNIGSTDGIGKAVGNATGSYYNNDPDFWLEVYEHRCNQPRSAWGRSDVWPPFFGSGPNQFVTRNNNRCQWMRIP